MKRLLIIGASMSLPTDELLYDDTYLYLLGRSDLGLEIVDKCVRARSTSTLLKGGPKGDARNLFEWYRPDFVIIHLGSSDCAPRLLRRNKKITKLINKTPFAKYIYSYLRRHQGRRIEYADLSPEEFRHNVEGYVRKVNPVPVGIVKISNVTKPASIKNPKFNDAIEIYNRVLEEIADNNQNATIIEALDASDSSMYQSDGIHLTPKGQRVIFDRCYSYLHSLINGENRTER